MVLDLEVYGPTGKKVFQQAPTVTLRAGVPSSVTQQYVVPAGAASGSYSFRIGVFGPGWSPLYTWNGNAGSFTVQ